MSCLRRFPLNPLTKPSRLSQFRCQSSNRRIQVVSNPAKTQHPTQQEHKWPFLNSEQSPVVATSTETTPKYDDQHSAVSSSSSSVGGRRYVRDTDYDRAKTIRRAIDFTTIEKRTLDFLRKTEDYINQQRSLANKISLYIVGGWVRDKLMGKQPPDMDVCIQNISPAEFVQILIDLNGFNSHSPRLIPLQQEGQSVTPTLPRNTGQRITVGTHKFEYDAGNGKTLQVAGIILFDTMVRMEFAEMRGDNNNNENDGDREIPSLQADALARELTVNAIYLRLQNLALIDPTGCGIEDLRKKVFRTPKRAKVTFMDDPIRVIRLIRFAGRFHDDGFTIDPKTFEALMDPDVRVYSTLSSLTIS